MSKTKKTFAQDSAYQSPWSTREKLGMLLWRIAWLILFRPTPKQLNRWRIGILKVFGAKISGRPFVSPSARIRIPWHLTLEDHACLGEEVVVYNLGHVTLKARCTIAQETYLCAGSHDLSTPKLPLVTAPVVIEEDVFVGARALILPGVTVARGAVIGAGSVVREDAPAWMVCAGNPCVAIKERHWSGPK